MIAPYCPITSYLRKGGVYTRETDVAETFRRERERLRDEAFDAEERARRDDRAECGRN